MREYFTEEEAEALLGQAYRVNPDASGYANVPPGTIGIVVDTYQARVELETDDGDNWGVIMLWLRDKDQGALERLRQSTPTHKSERPLMDHFSRVDLLIRFSEDAEHAPGERAMTPIVPFAQPGAGTDLTRLEAALALTAAAGRLLPRNREVSVGPAVGALAEAEKELQERMETARSMDAKGWLSDA